MTPDRKYVRLREQGRRLASRREDLIAAGVDPAQLVVPLHPDQPSRSRRVARHAQPLDPDVEKRHASDLARVWLIVAVACIAAFAGCIATAGAMLVVAQEPTWHVWAAATAGIAWFVGGCASAVNVDRLHHWARGDAQHNA